MRKLIREVHRRALWQALVIYGAAAWLVLQVVDTMAGALSLPEWSASLALFLLIIGLPVVLTTAFIQSGRPAGSSLTGPLPAPSEADTPPEASSGTWADRRISPTLEGLFTWRNAIAGGVIAFALWGAVAMVMMVLGVGPGSGWGSGPRAAGDQGRIGIAVLPFSSIGQDEQSLILSAGLHDDLLTRLSKIHGLRVTSRSSVLAYRDPPVDVGEIAERLGVEYVIEGSVAGAGGQVSLNVQLIAAASADHLWAETYNRALTVTNLFAIQKELVERIAGSLSATLLPDQAGIAQPPTTNQEAYNAFLRGHSYFHAGPGADAEFDRAIAMYERATDLDPGFAEAHARLSLALGMKSEFAFVPDPALLPRARAAARRALELDPDLPEAELAMAQINYTGERNLDLALEALTNAAQRGLHSADLFHLLGAVQRRMGDLEGAIASFEELVRLDPLSAHFHEDLGTTYWYAGRWTDAGRTLWHSVDLADGAVLSPFDWLTTAALMQGDLGLARTIADSAARTGHRLWWVESEIELLARDFEAAAAVTRDSSDFWTGFALDLGGRRAAARPYLEAAAEGSRSAIAEDSTQHFPYMRLAWASAALGRRAEARRAADRALALRPVSVDFLDGAEVAWWRVLTLVRLGDLDEALEALERLVALKPPGHYTPAYLGLHPALDPLRSSPRFAALLE